VLFDLEHLSRAEQLDRLVAELGAFRGQSIEIDLAVTPAADGLFQPGFSRNLVGKQGGRDKAPRVAAPAAFEGGSRSNMRESSGADIGW